MSVHLLMIDNYDSFTYNLVQGFLTLGAVVTVRYNDDITPRDVARLSPTHLVISPGPGRPERAGSSVRIIDAVAGSIPVLGVCLGHQAIAVVFGGEVGSAGELMHGKDSEVFHDGETIYEGMSRPFTAGRYHSLAVTLEGLPDELKVSAHTAAGEIMGIRHVDLPVEGVQFHPESVLTPEGHRLMQNFLGVAGVTDTLTEAVAGS